MMDPDFLSVLVIIVALLVFVVGLINICRPVTVVGMKENKTSLLVVSVMLAVVGAIFGIVGHKVSADSVMQQDHAGDSAPRAAELAITPTPASPKSTAPADELRFIGIVEQTRNDYRTTPNYTIGDLRADRAAKLCAAFAQPAVRDWTGTVRHQSVGRNGHGELQVTIAPLFALSSGTNSEANIIDRPLLVPGSEVFDAAAALKAGERVVFSGEFIADKADCFQSAGLRVSPTTPEFLFRFIAIRKN